MKLVRGDVEVGEVVVLPLNLMVAAHVVEIGGLDAAEAAEELIALVLQHLDPRGQLPQRRARAALGLFSAEPPLYLFQLYDAIAEPLVFADQLLREISGAAK